MSVMSRGVCTRPYLAITHTHTSQGIVLYSECGQLVVEEVEGREPGTCRLSPLRPDEGGDQGYCITGEAVLPDNWTADGPAGVSWDRVFFKHPALHFDQQPTRCGSAAVDSYISVSQRSVVCPPILMFYINHCLP